LNIFQRKKKYCYKSAVERFVPFAPIDGYFGAVNSFCLATRRAIAVLFSELFLFKFYVILIFYGKEKISK
jgi:hypothetical protein